MGTYFVAVEAVDPQGELDDGGIYGGEARFFVLTADHLIAALAVLADSLQANNLKLTRVLYAGDVGDFDDEMLPFAVDIDGMVETAESTGEICVSEAHVFEFDLSEGRLSGVYACCIDAFDPDWADEDEGEYGGHYQLAVIRADSATAALQAVLAEFTAEGIDILGLEGLVDVAAFPFDGYEFEFDAEEAIAEVEEEGGMVLSDAYAYPPEAVADLRRLDS